MMRNSMMAILMAGMVLIAACVPSLNPFYSEETLTTDDALVGGWGDKNAAKPQWTISKLGEEKAYKIIAEDGKTLTLHLFKLGDQLFFDFSPIANTPSSGEANFIPSHTLAQAWIEKDLVRVAFMSPEKVEKLMVGGPELVRFTQIEYEKGKKAVVLTGRTPRLQSFLEKYQDKIFADPAEFSRIGETAKPNAK